MYIRVRSGIIGNNGAINFDGSTFIVDSSSASTRIIKGYRAIIYIYGTFIYINPTAAILIRSVIIG